LQEKSPPWHRGRTRPIFAARAAKTGDFTLRRFAERFDRFAFRATHVEHRQQLGHLQ
jgi:hypothetical protein